MSDSREHILETAALLFMQKSYKEVTMKQIVDKTGLSKGAFYHHFSSKEQLFLEIVDKFFLTGMRMPYAEFSHESLWQFYHDLIANTELQFKGLLMKMGKDEMGAVNIFSMMFDSLRLFPDFRKKVMMVQEEEIKAWMTIIRLAKTKGEIKSKIGDREIAQIFVSITDGTGMRLIMEGKIDRIGKEMIAQWDEFYNLLKK